MAVSSFGLLDYLVLVGFLVLSSAIGVYFAWTDRAEQSNRTFLTANKQLGWLPVSLSLMASFLSSNNVLGFPAEVFVHGTTLWVGAVSSSVAILLAAFAFLPIYYEMDVTSINEYLERRFKSTAVRKLASFLFLIETLMYLGVVLYGPSLALGSVTGISVWSSILFNGLVCTFYTAIGGIKAVVWTDVVQMILMYSGYVMVIISGLHHLGGFTNMWNLAEEGGRIIFLNLSPSVFETYTTWNVLLGLIVLWMSAYCATQTQVQRYTSIGSLRGARKALLLNIPGVALLLLLSVLSGLILFAVYGKCDPRLKGDITRADQLMPYIVQDLLGDYPGLCGVLVAAVYSGCLSSLSSGFNAMAAVTWDDFVRPCVRLPEKRAVLLTKCIAAGYGLLSIAIAFVSGTFKSLVQAGNSLVGAMAGPLFSVFLLGFFFPCCKKKGVLVGMITGIAVSIWFTVGSSLHPKHNNFLPTSTTGCTNFNESISLGSFDGPQAPSGILMFYHISFVWTSVIGFVATLPMALLVSLIFERNDEQSVDPRYVCSFSRKFMKNGSKPDKLNLKTPVSPAEMKKLIV